uniref:Ficolin-1-like isoform X2 n=1 Tax=Crassostrea virginica TaxID=6565 RepID=A0A8B8AMA5_CRAVI|nr:ficolin-1-like isoform X2 [Crassostrea virginica]
MIFPFFKCLFELEKDITSSLVTHENRMNTMDTEFQQQMTSLNKSLILTVNRVLQKENDIFSNCSTVSSVLTRLETNISDINDRIHELGAFGNVDCFNFLKRSPDTMGQDGVYTIYPDNIRKKTVYCDMTTEGGGWTVIQNRIDGSTDFYRTWTEYKEGFGNSSHNYWIGNDVIHLLTKDKTQVLRVELERFNGEKGYAEYSTFIVGDELSKYKLTVSGYNGTIGDKLNRHNGWKFTTPDQDNDGYSVDNCAHVFKGAWWYYNCYQSNLNGKYMGPHVSGDISMNWNWPSTDHESLKTSRMMIRSK